MKYNVLDLFCGAGGLSYGFNLEDFIIKGGIDLDDSALQTHALNFESGYHDWTDITKITNTQIIERYVNKEENKIDVIIGGPPCQGFSAANMWQSDEDKKEKNKLFYEFLRFVKIIKPKVFLMENVRQILTKDKGFVKKEIENTMKQLGYNITSDTLSSNHFGVPQKRVRAFFVGIRNNINKNFDFKNLQTKKEVLVRHALEDLYSFDERYLYSTKIDSKLDYKQTTHNNPYLKYLRKDGGNIICNHNISYPKDIVKERMSHVKEGENWRVVPEDLWDRQRVNRHSSAYRRLDSNKVSVTIDTGHMNYFHPKFNRVPTVRESARLQSFPDSFIFIGNQGSQFRQVGNAVPPLLAKALAIEIKKILDGIK